MAKSRVRSNFIRQARTRYLELISSKCQRSLFPDFSSTQLEKLTAITNLLCCSLLEKETVGSWVVKLGGNRLECKIVIKPGNV